MLVEHSDPKVTKTLITGPNGEQYLATERVQGFPGFVYATGRTREDAIAACLLKKEAHDAALERRHTIQISAECALA